jgi:hypothetical protein
VLFGINRRFLKGPCAALRTFCLAAHGVVATSRATCGRWAEGMRTARAFPGGHRWQPSSQWLPAFPPGAAILSRATLIIAWTPSSRASGRLAARPA